MAINPSAVVGIVFIGIVLAGIAYWVWHERFRNRTRSLASFSGQNSPSRAGRVAPTVISNRNDGEEVELRVLSPPQQPDRAAAPPPFNLLPITFEELYEDGSSNQSDFARSEAGATRTQIDSALSYADATRNHVEEHSVNDQAEGGTANEQSSTQQQHRRNSVDEAGSANFVRIRRAPPAYIRDELTLETPAPPRYTPSAHEGETQIRA